MDLNILRLANIFAYFEEKSISSIQLNGETINMILPNKVCINFHTYVFNTFSRIPSSYKNKPILTDV